VVRKRRAEVEFFRAVEEQILLSSFSIVLTTIWFHLVPLYDAKQRVKMKQFAPFLRAKFTSQNKDYDDDFDDSNGQKLHSERIEVEIKSIVEMCVVYVEENVAVLSLFPSTKSSFSHRGTTGKEYSYAEQEYDSSLCTKRDDENPSK
jgi:hypothetical protein